MIFDSNNLPVVDLFYPFNDSGDRIIRAVNSHPTLLAAAKELVKMDVNLVAIYGLPQWMNLKAAIAAAEEPAS